MSQVSADESKWSLFGAVALAATVFAGNEFFYWWFKPRSLFKKEYQKDLVYVYQYPRMRCIPSLSPNCLALESWLRLNKIKYENTEGCLWYRSKENILPFIELNGMQYSGNEKIVTYLTEKFQVTDVDTGVSIESVKKMETVLDDLMRCYMYFRYVKNVKILFSKAIIGNLSATQPIMPWCFEVLVKLVLSNSCAYRNADARQIAHLVSENMKEKLKSKGYTRFLKSEIVDKAHIHLAKICKVLGNKEYLYGTKPSHADCMLFGITSQIVYVPYKSPLKKMLQNEYPSLFDHCIRMKKTCWPDWDRILKSGKMNTKYPDDDDDD